ncbi:MAG: SRPBCC family protein [Anaerolineales bacterium]|nr:SRPBCC family protein [Anaerolineales bacterium]
MTMKKGAKRLLNGLGLILILLLGLYLSVIPRAEVWGATHTEVVSEYPGDSLVADPAYQTTKAITIQNSPDQIWPWLLQLGVDRGGMYSYDGLENLFGLNVHSAETIHPEWQDLQSGDFIRFTPVDYALNPGPGLWVVLLEKNYLLVGCFGREDHMPRPCTATWQFILNPRPDGATRLILRTRSATAPGFGKQFARLVNLLPFVMERKMLLGLQTRAETLLP